MTRAPASSSTNLQQQQFAVNQAGFGMGPYGGMQRRAGRQAGSALSQLIGQYNTAFGEAKSANEARYQQLLNIANATTGQREADLRRDYGQQQANMMQGLARTGMANTTVAPTMQMGIQREQQSALNRLADQMQQTKLGIIERRTDQYPDLGALASLAGALGQGAGLAGAGGIAGALRNLQLG